MQYLFNQTLHQIYLIGGETVETVSDFIFGGSKITADGDCSDEIKRHFLLGRKVITNLDSILKSRDIANKGLGFPGAAEVKASAYNAGDLGSIPGSRRSLGEGNGNPHQCSCLENPTDRGAWWATVHRVAESQTRLSDFTFNFSWVFQWSCMDMRVGL